VARIHLYCPDWLQRRARLERPHLNQSRLYNQALIKELDGPEAVVYICEACGDRTARAFRFLRSAGDEELVGAGLSEATQAAVEHQR
jgi:hypothetical protein